MEILKAGDTGTYEELSAIENTDNLVIAYNPPIEALLERAKQLKGGSLSESEENRIRTTLQLLRYQKMFMMQHMVKIYKFPFNKHIKNRSTALRWTSLTLRLLCGRYVQPLQESKSCH